MSAAVLDGQLDLLDLVVLDAGEEWAARFTRAPWQPRHAAHDPACAGRIGWQCPGCGQVELNEFLLNLNHGYDPTVPGHMAGAIETFGQSCTRLMLLASQERARQWKEAHRG